MIHARRSRSGNIMRAFCIAHYRICTRDVETSTPPRAALSLEERPSSLTGARRRAAEELVEATALATTAVEATAAGDDSGGDGAAIWRSAPCLGLVVCFGRCFPERLVGLALLSIS